MKILAKKDNFSEKTYTTAGGIKVNLHQQELDLDHALDTLENNIDKHRGAIFSSSFDYPGRYSRWDIGFINPCIELKSYDKLFIINALNKRGEVVLAFIGAALAKLNDVEDLVNNGKHITGKIKLTRKHFAEEERSKQPTIFSVIRVIKNLFYAQDDDILGLYGAFGYDLIFQFDAIKKRMTRDSEQPDMVLYLPDSYIVVDHQLDMAYLRNYEFSLDDKTTEGLDRTGEEVVMKQHQGEIPKLVKGEYANIVKLAKHSFKRGDLFEVVPSQVLYEKCAYTPIEIYNRLRDINPSPYGFIINLGLEYLIGASPEMFVRVEGKRIETCPISGTIKRGKDAIEDEARIRELLNSKKDESELTMCTDVDRNDKSRICVPGSVRVIGRRQIEMYSKLIHTVDHVEGKLRPEFDSLDAFLTHMWAVTVTGAPKKSAIQWLENHEASPRKWYGGAVGFMKFNGDLNTGLTLRTINLKDGVAQVRVGATLLYDSIPEAEEQETYTKASAMLASLDTHTVIHPHDKDLTVKQNAKKILIVDHEDSFVHTLANYFRQTGADVTVLRYSLAQEVLAKDDTNYDLVLLSPGPGNPQTFDLAKTISLCLAKKLPIFGVCLGLQGIVEYFGGKLGTLAYPQHGKKAIVEKTQPSELLEGLPDEFVVARYHSLYGYDVPEVLNNVAQTKDDKILMAVEHKTLPIAAVQFHPESIMMLQNGTGMKIVENVIKYYCK